MSCQDRGGHMGHHHHHHQQYYILIIMRWLFSFSCFLRMQTKICENTEDRFTIHLLVKFKSEMLLTKKVQQKGCFCENLEHSKDFLHCQNGRDSCCRVIYQPCYLWDKMCNCSRGSPWQQERVSLYCHADFPTRDLALHLCHSLYRILLSDAFVWIQESDIDFLKRDPAHHLWHSALQTGSSHLSDSDSDKSQDCMFVAPALLYTISDKNFVRTLLFGPKLKFGESWGIRCRCRMHPSPPWEVAVPFLSLASLGSWAGEQLVPLFIDIAPGWRHQCQMSQEGACGPKNRWTHPPQILSHSSMISNLPMLAVLLD